MNPGVAVRAGAARVVAAVMGGEALDSPLAAALTSLPPRDQALCRELCFGTLRFFPQLDAILARLLDKPLRARDQDVQALALIGLYQLEHLRIPPHAAVSATVDATAALKKPRMRALLNALLRRYQRESATLCDDLPPAAAHAHPEWLWEAFGRDWPTEREAIVAANNGRPPMTLRVNLAKTSQDDYLHRLAAAGIEARAGLLSPCAAVLAEAQDVDSLPGFREGLCSVQDESAQLAAQLLQPQNSERILDACAAPGGKSGHILELAPGCDLTAMDISATRLQRVEDNHQRLGQNPTLLCADGATPSLALRAAAPFDAILLDAPCSATGVIRRHPDIKLLRRPADIDSFAAQQRALLEGLWPLLAEGGRLLYVTCSVLEPENSALVRDFIARRTDATLLPLQHPLRDDAGFACEAGWQLLPDTEGGDGLYFALLGKKPVTTGAVLPWKTL